jgi:hypothetical protein
VTGRERKYYQIARLVRKRQGGLLCKNLLTIIHGTAYNSKGPFWAVAFTSIYRLPSGNQSEIKEITREFSKINANCRSFFYYLIFRRACLGADAGFDAPEYHSKTP